MFTRFLCILAVAWLPIACGGDSTEDEIGGTGAPDNSSSDTPNETGSDPETPTTEEITCASSVGGDIRIGEDSFALLPTSAVLSSQHNATCLTRLSLQLDWQGCSLNKNMNVPI